MLKLRVVASCFAVLLVVIVTSSSAASMATAHAALHTPAGVPAEGTEPLPQGVYVETVLPEMDHPVAMAFDPQGRLFYTEKESGNVRLFANGVLRPDPVITFRPEISAELGLDGIAIDPDFNSNHFIYIYYTCGPSGGCASMENRVVRFVEQNGTGLEPTIIFTSPQAAIIHAGGNLHFGPDGKLYITVGDSYDAANAQKTTVSPGKIHRINSDGSIPPDNPDFHNANAVRSIYAIGLRNSFDFTFDPLSPPGRIFAIENGPNCDDELNRIEGGYDYGWRDSYPCDDADPSSRYNTIPPLWYLPASQCCEAPAGVTVYTGSQIPEWRNGLFMATYNQGILWHFYLDESRTTVLSVNKVEGVTATNDIETGPDGALWFMHGGGWTTGSLQRIVMSSPSPTPTPTPPCPGERFSDVCPGDYFYAPVLYLNTRGIISGYADGSFRPYNSTTRAQTAKIVSLASGLTGPVSGQTFQDVSPGSDFYPYIERMSARGYVAGYTCGTMPGEPCVPPLNRPYFRPDAIVTRGQLSKLVALAFRLTYAAGRQTFEDVGRDNVFYTYIEQIATAGIIGGYPCGTAPSGPCVAPLNLPYFRPEVPVTRGQTAKIVYFTGALPTATATRTPTATRTSTRLPTSTRTATRTATKTATRTATRTATSTRLPTSTKTAIMTATRTATATRLPSRTVTSTVTSTRLPTSTRTPTRAPTITPTSEVQGGAGERPYRGSERSGGGCPPATPALTYHPTLSTLLTIICKNRSSLVVL